MYLHIIQNHQGSIHTRHGRISCKTQESSLSSFYFRMVHFLVVKSYQSTSGSGYFLTPNAAANHMLPFHCEILKAFVHSQTEMSTTGKCHQKKRRMKFTCLSTKTQTQYQTTAIMG